MAIRGNQRHHLFLGRAFGECGAHRRSIEIEKSKPIVDESVGIRAVAWQQPTRDGGVDAELVPDDGGNQSS